MKINKKLTVALFTFYVLRFTYYAIPANASVIGPIANPLTKYSGSAGEGLFVFISNLFKLTGVIAGIYMIFQFIQAGFAYINAGGDVKLTTAAWNKIWQSILGMVIIASAFVLASVVERFTGIKILNPVIYGPQ